MRTQSKLAPVLIAAVRAAEITGQGVGPGQATGTVTLKRAKGNVVDALAGDEVGDFDRIEATCTEAPAPSLVHAPKPAVEKQ